MQYSVTLADEKNMLQDFLARNTRALAGCTCMVHLQRSERCQGKKLPLTARCIFWHEWRCRAQLLPAPSRPETCPAARVCAAGTSEAGAALAAAAPGSPRLEDLAGASEVVAALVATALEACAR